MSKRDAFLAKFKREYAQCTGALAKLEGLEAELIDLGLSHTIDIDKLDRKLRSTRAQARRNVSNLIAGE